MSEKKELLEEKEEVVPAKDDSQASTEEKVKLPKLGEDGADCVV